MAFLPLRNANDADPLARWVLQRLFPDRSEAPAIPLTAEELRDLLAAVAVMTRRVSGRRSGAED